MRKVDDILDRENLLDLLNVLTDGIYISDTKGKTLWVNSSSAHICGKKPSELIGRNVLDLELEGIFNPSITRIAIETQKPVTTVQVMKDGRKYIVTGNLIFNKQGKINMIIAHSRDITEAVKTTSQLEDAESLLRRYSQEIRTMKIKQDNIEENPFVGNSPAYQALLEMVERISNVDTTVLIFGETGVGKNVIANKMHQLSERYKSPFVHINCSAIPETLIESELFGYQKGAFSGANSSGKVGLVQMADKGTLFLDEISEMPLHLQSKLLQLLQNKTFLPIGATQIKTTDTRIIASTNRDLLQMIDEGKFRADLYYRLNILPIHIPPLKERKEDIFPLIYYYLKKFNHKHSQNRHFSKELLDFLQNYDWPGNIRELENLVERLVITTINDKIDTDDLPQDILKNKSNSSLDYFFDNNKSLAEILDNVEKRILGDAYKKYQTTRKTAQALKLSQTTLVRRLKKHQISM